MDMKHDLKIDLKIGSTLPLTRDNHPLGQPIGERWYCIIARRQQDARLAARLEAIGFIEAWRPTETAWRRVKGPRRKIPYERNLAPGYVFALTDREIRWHLLFSRLDQQIRHVLSVNDQPLAIPETALAEMQQLPARIAVKRAQEEERRRIRPGDKARAISGALAGRYLQITDVDAGIAYFIAGAVKGKAEVQDLMRVESARDV